MKIAKSIDQLVGNTPLLEVVNIEKELNLYAKILVKLECFNPAGSVKDRTALYMLNDAEKQGLITEGATVIEPTSGNTGIGLSAICASRGYKVVLTMPDTMSVERINLLKAYGANVLLTDGKLGMKGAIEKAEEIKNQTENSIVLGQFDNPSNIEAHYQTTAREIYADTDGKIDYFVAGVGTGGTLSGSAKFLKEKNSNVKVIAVEPKNSPMIKEGVFGAHKIQGIGANFIPKNFKREYCDEVVGVSDENAFYASRLMAQKQGILVGISSGAALYSAIEIARDKENNDKTIVVILPDTGDRYLSTELFR